MKNNFFKQSFYIVALSFILFSCQKNKVLGQSNYSDFISQLQKSSPQERQKELLRISEGLTKALSEAEDFGVYFGFGMSFSSGDDNTIDWDTVNWSRLDIEESAISIVPPAEIQTQFRWYVDSAYATQQRQLPNSRFEISTESYSSIDRKNVKTNILQRFSEKGNLAPSEVGLNKVDSLDVEFLYSHTLSLDTLTIPQGVDSVTFQGHTVYIKKLEPQHIELNLPMNLYNKFEGHLGITPNNKYISSKNNSFMPSWGLAPSISANARQALMIFDKYAKQPLSDDDLKQFESELTEECYMGLHKVFEFVDAEKELDKLIDEKGDTFEQISEQIGEMRRFIEANATLFAPVEQNMEIAYPYPVKGIIFCFTKDTMTFSAQKTIPVEHEVVPYDVIYDESEFMFGVVDSLNEIVIKPQYKNLQSLGDLFFYDEGAKVSYRLDEKNKKMQPLKTKHHYLRSAGSGLYLFYSEEGYSGILNNEFKEVIPFEYQSFDQYGELIVGLKRTEDKYVYELFTSDVEKIKLPTIVTVIEDRFSSGIILIDEEENQAFITKSGEIIIPFDKSHELSLLNSDKVFLLKKEGVCYLVNKQGNEIRLPEFVYRVYAMDEILGDDRLAFVDKNDQYGFLNEKGEMILPSRYEFIYGNHGGFSMVLLSDLRRVMIDDSGKILKDFGGNAEIDAVMYDDNVYYVIDGDVYDWRGNKTDMKETDLSY